MYKRSEYQVIMNRLKEQRKFIQVVMGTRQIGKPTVIKQVLKDSDMKKQITTYFIAYRLGYPYTASSEDAW